MSIEMADDRLAELLDPEAEVEQLATGGIWTEGPVYLPAEHPAGPATLYSDIPNNRICRWSEAEGFSVFRADAEYTNGHTLDRQGRIVSCSHGHRRIERTEPDGSVTELVAHYQGRRFNSPNDVVVASDGAIWFTDPSYGILSDHEGHAAQSEIGVHYVFRFDPETEALIDADTIIVLNKADLLEPASVYRIAGREALLLSCQTGEGVDDLSSRLTELAARAMAPGEAPVLTRARHRQALLEVTSALARIDQAPEEPELALIAEDLRIAMQAMGRITGRVGVEDVLDQIFSTFCIGK